VPGSAGAVAAGAAPPLDEPEADPGTETAQVGGGSWWMLMCVTRLGRASQM